MQKFKKLKFKGYIISKSNKSRLKRKIEGCLVTVEIPTVVKVL